MLGYCIIAISLLTALAVPLALGPATTPLLSASTLPWLRRGPATIMTLTCAGVIAILLTSQHRPALAGALATGTFAAVTVLVIIDHPSIAPSILGSAAAMTVISFALRWATRGSLGRGDIHYSPMLGALIGWAAPWPDLPSTLLTAWILTILSAALVSVIGLLSRQLTRASTIPYGPFMTLGTVVAVATTLGAGT